MKRKSQNPAIPLVRVKDRKPLSCNTCGAVAGFRFSRYKEVEGGGKRVPVFVCQKCGAEQ